MAVREAHHSLWNDPELLHHTNDAFDDIVNVRKITLAITIVENLYRLTFNQFIGETKICHVWPPAGP